MRRLRLLMLIATMLAPFASIPAGAANSCSGICSETPGGCPSCVFRFFGGGICGTTRNGDECSCAEFACPFLSAETDGPQIASAAPGKRELRVVRVMTLAPRV